MTSNISQTILKLYIGILVRGMRADTVYNPSLRGPYLIYLPESTYDVYLFVKP